LLLMPFSTGMMLAGTFPTDSHPPTLEAARDLLHAVCPADSVAVTDRHGVNAGCKSCPAIVSDSSGTMNGDSDTIAFSLQGVIYGSFTRAGVQQSVASFSGCEPHVNNFGGSILLEKSPAGWKAESYEPGFISDECLKYQLRGGRDLLLCHEGYVGQGVGVNSLYRFDYTLPEKQQTNTFFSTTDTVDACFVKNRVMGSIEYVRLRDLNGDGMPDLVVGVKAARIKPPAGHEQDCGAPIVRPVVKTEELDFLFSDGTFKIAPWSAGIKRELDGLFAQ
jgi:hypothetical protein